MNRLKITLVAAVALASAVNVFNANKSETLSEIALANVEALTNYEFGGVEGVSYCTIHIRCFDMNGSASGRYTADSYTGEACTYSTPHSHSCSNCSTR